jgi:thiosulfate dehydrogenase [quinone] large subunit
MQEAWVTLSRERGDAAAGLALVRIGAGLVFLFNGLAKVLNFDGWHPFPGYLITGQGAKGILIYYAAHNPVGPYTSVVHNLMLPNWGLFQAVVAVSEVAVGVSLTLGVAARWGALLGLLMQLHLQFAAAWTNEWAFEYWVEWVPLLALVVAGGGGTRWGLDGLIPAPFGAGRRSP